ncbi:MAG: hypothetical protein QM796_12090 [Chthoniobacteraceae bacterium]
MKNTIGTFRRPCTLGLLSLGLGLSVIPLNSAFATSDTWTGSSSATWATNANWSTTPATVPGSGDTATFSGASANTTIDLGSGVTIGALLFDTSSAAAYTIGTGSSQTLTLGTVGNAITMNSTVANNQIIAASLALATTSTAGTTSTYYTVTNNSTTNSLTLSGGMHSSPQQGPT